MQFCVSDEVRAALPIGSVTDVSTVLLQVKPRPDGSRMGCPCDLVRPRATAE
jgi:hypothetical protein